MKFRMIDGEVFTGRSYDAVVEAMASEKLTEPHSIDTYRRATASRVAEMYEVKIDAGTNKGFITSLVAANLMERIK